MCRVVDHTHLVLISKDLRPTSKTHIKSVFERCSQKSVLRWSHQSIDMSLGDHRGGGVENNVVCVGVGK